ncbi:MAG: heat shock protein Hsp20 [Cyanobacteriota bacterium]
MTIIRYNPWSEMNSLQRQLNKMFDDALTPTSLVNFSNFSKVPPAELTETEENLVLKLEIPGMQPSELNIEATAKSVSISGERKSETHGEEADKTHLCGAVYHKGTTSFRTEFRYGSFQRVVPLPVKIQNTEVKAEYKNGILYQAEKNKVVKVNFSDEVDAQ